MYKEKSDSLLEIVRNNELREQLLALQKKYEADKLVFENKQIKLEKEKQAYFYLVVVLLIVLVLLKDIKRKIYGI